MSNPSTENENPGKVVSIDELYGVYREANANELIIDVRSTSVDRDVSIEGSMQLPVHDVVASPNQFVESLKKFKLVYLVDWQGESAKEAYDALVGSGSSNVMYVATGGMKEWTTKKYPHFSRSGAKAAAIEEINEDWRLDFGRMEKKAWLFQPPPEVQDRLGEIKVLNINGSFVVYDKATKDALLLFPTEENDTHYFDQIVRKGLFCKGVVGHDPYAEFVAKHFFTKTIRPGDSFSFLNKAGKVSEGLMEFSGLQWESNKVQLAPSH